MPEGPLARKYSRFDALKAAYIPLITGWAILFAFSTIIFRDFAMRIQDAKKIIDSCSNESQGPPDWIYVMVIGILLFYGSFGFVGLYQIFDKNRHPERYEKMYIILSLVSKTLMGGSLGYGYFARLKASDEGNVSNRKCKNPETGTECRPNFS